MKYLAFILLGLTTSQTGERVVEQARSFFTWETILVAVVSFLLGVGFHYLLAFKIIPNRHHIYVWWFVLRNHGKLGEPCKTDQILKRQGYSLGYSYKHKTALWVSYIVSKQSVDIDVDRAESFYADTDIPENYRVKPEDYTNSGYDKGHLAPSAAIDFSRKSNDETFAMTNVALQNPKLNRQVWSSLEDLERTQTAVKGKLGIITGPVFSSRPRKVNDISVPKAFYKVIYSFQHKKSIGFVFPNEDIKAADLWKYAMTVQEVETETGYTFFNKLGNKGKTIKKKIDLEWWQN